MILSKNQMKMNWKVTMYKTQIITLLALLLLGCYPKKNTHETISKIEVDQMLTNWKLAMVTKDTQLLNSILSDNFIYSGSSNGKLTNKKQMIENMENDNSVMLEPIYYDVVVTYFEDMAIVRAKETLCFIEDNNDTTEIKLSFTDVYKKTNGKLLTVSTHSSPISTKIIDY